MAKHTAGPWRVGPTGELWVAGPPPFGQVICHVGETDDEEDVANARLIAAAPDLLKFAELIVAYSDELQKAGLLDLAEIAAVEVAKAKGTVAT